MPCQSTAAFVSDSSEEEDLTFSVSPGHQPPHYSFKREPMLGKGHLFQMPDAQEGLSSMASEFCPTDTHTERPTPGIVDLGPLDHEEVPDASGLDILKGERDSSNERQEPRVEDDGELQGGWRR